jgi:hypothetical protein
MKWYLIGGYKEVFGASVEDSVIHNAGIAPSQKVGARLSKVSNPTNNYTRGVALSKSIASCIVVTLPIKRTISITMINLRHG